MTVFGERLRAVRRTRGLSQARLAQLAGVAPTAVTMLETGYRQPANPAVVVALARALNTDAGDMLAAAGLPDVDAPPAVTVPAAIAADARLSGPDKAVLTVLYDRLVR